MATPENVYDTIDRLVGFILRYAVTLAAISALAMALIELVKGLLSWRDRFHKRRLRKWIESVSLEDVKGTLASDRKPPPPETDAEFHRRIYDSLIQLTTGEKPAEDTKEPMDKGIESRPWIISSGNALFALSLDKMMGQIQDAADTAMTNPDLYPELYAFLTAGARSEDVNHWQEWAKVPPVRSADKADEAKKQADTYARLRQFIRRRLDAFQVTASYRWETGNQTAAIILGAVLLFGSLMYLTAHEGNANHEKGPGLLILILASLIGGIMAPVAKDLVIALKKVRSGV